MGDLKTSVVVDLKGNLRRNAKKFSQSIDDFSKRGRRGLSRLSSKVGNVGSKLNKMGNRFGALVAGAAVVGATKKVIDFDAALTQLAVDADIADDRLAGVKQRIFDVAKQPDIKVNPNKLLAAIKEITARTGEFDVGMDNLRNIGLLIRATGAEGVDAGALVANFYEKFRIKTPEKLLAILDEAAILGKKGAFELRDLATEGNAVSAAYAATGRTGPIAAREMLAILQIVRRTTPSAAEASTAFERMIGTLTSEKVELLQKNGIQIWDEDKLNDGIKVARSIPAIIEDILKATNGDPEILAKIFDVRALRAINAFKLEFQETGALGSIAKFMNVVGDGKTLAADARRNASTAKAGLQSLSNKTSEVTDDLISQPTKDIARAVEGVSSMSAIDNTKILSGVLGDLALDAIRLDRPLRALGRTMIDISKAPFQDNNDGIQLAPGISGKIELEIESAQKIRVKRIESKNIDIEVGTGMVSP